MWHDVVTFIDLQNLYIVLIFLTLILVIKNIMFWWQNLKNWSIIDKDNLLPII